MKKILALVLTLALLLSNAALAAAPSKTTKDMTKFTTRPANVGTAAPVLFTVQSTAAEAALKALTEVGAAKYFEGVNLAEMLGATDAELVVSELTGLEATGFASNCGDVTATLQFATPYTADQKVAVLIGMVNGMNVQWSAFEGVGTMNGGIKVLLPQETVLSVQTGTALIAIVSK